MRVGLLGACLTSACLTPANPTSPVEEPVAPPGGEFGIVVEPRLGHVVSTPTASTELSFVGVHERPDYQLEIQVLDDPDAFDSWVTFALATTDTRPSSSDPTVYEWRV